MSSRVFAAIDIGASGGRVIAGICTRRRVVLEEIHRFPNGVAMSESHLRWEFRRLFDEALIGLAKLAERYPQVESIGVDTWAVDYGLLDPDGELLAEPIAYRDERTAAAINDVHDRIGVETLYSTNGLQYLPFNTIYQLAAEQQGELWSRAAHAVLLPDLLAYWLTGALATEATNASTTGLVDVHTGDWSDALLATLGIDRAILPPIVQPGTVRGNVRPELRARLGLRDDVVVTSVGSHDTASAVVAVPASDRPFAYIASGTWSLVGLELETPVLADEARVAGFTNEAGVDRRVRFLHNVGGLWLLQECMREWDASDSHTELPELIRRAGALPPGGPAFDVDLPDLVAPGDMPRRIAKAADDLTLVEDQPRLARCIFDSLANAYGSTVESASRLADVDSKVVHIVGGGSRNALLCQLTADRTGLPVTAGPVEATALGNVLVQMRAHGAAPDTLEELRQLSRESSKLRTFVPAASPAVNPGPGSEVRR